MRIGNLKKPRLRRLLSICAMALQLDIKAVAKQILQLQRQRLGQTVLPLHQCFIQWSFRAPRQANQTFRTRLQLFPCHMRFRIIGNIEIGTR